MIANDDLNLVRYEQIKALDGCFRHQNCVAFTMQ
jgi:hypothetical protein